MLEIQESINVWVLFKKNIIAPYSFSWRGREIKIDKISLVHTSKNGASLFYHFSVMSGGNFYELRFDSTRMQWFVDKIEEGSS